LDCIVQIAGFWCCIIIAKSKELKETKISEVCSSCSLFLIPVLIHFSCSLLAAYNKRVAVYSPKNHCIDNLGLEVSTSTYLCIVPFKLPAISIDLDDAQLPPKPKSEHILDIVLHYASQRQHNKGVNLNVRHSFHHLVEGHEHRSRSQWSILK